MVIRCRPLSDKEREDQQQVVVEVDEVSSCVRLSSLVQTRTMALFCVARFACSPFLRVEYDGWDCLCLSDSVPLACWCICGSGRFGFQPRHTITLVKPPDAGDAGQ